MKRIAGIAAGILLFLYGLSICLYQAFYGLRTDHSAHKTVVEFYRYVETLIPSVTTVPKESTQDKAG